MAQVLNGNLRLQWLVLTDIDSVLIDNYIALINKIMSVSDNVHLSFYAEILGVGWVLKFSAVHCALDVLRRDAELTSDNTTSAC